MTDWVLAGARSQVTEGGPGLRCEIEVPSHSKPEPAFVVCLDNEIHAYLNRCGHVPVQLDWPEGQFFDDESVFLICATHGASYHPKTGECLSGPCEGRGLVRLETRINDDQVWVRWPNV